MRIDSDLTRLPSVEAWVQSRLGAEDLSSALRGALEQLAGVLEAERTREHEVFLSVVIRTQLKRWEQLKDALLCLAAQTDQGFELLLMLHDADEADADRVEQLIAEYPSDFSERVTVRSVAGGGRTRPLVVALQMVRGEYVAFFDDDDLLMANWVEAFRDGARETPGKLIRANVAVQHNLPEIWTNGAAGQRSVTVAAPEYADHYNLLDHLDHNRTPFMALAFPSSFFTQWGERFEESLPVLEDWDIALRAAGLLGVNSSTELTAIYRHWDEVETSYTSHHEDEWDEAGDLVRSRISSAPFLMPVEANQHVQGILAREARTQREMVDILSSPFWRITSPARRAIGRWRRMRGSQR